MPGWMSRSGWDAGCDQLALRTAILPGVSSGASRRTGQPGRGTPSIPAPESNPE